MRPIADRLTYANVMSTLAVFLVVGGGAAYAANTVSSTDIVDGEVRNVDLAPSAVSGGKLAANSVSTSKVVNNSLTGNDIVESTLAEQVPSALLGGFGRTGTVSAFCNPDNATFLACATLNLNVPSPTRALAIGRIQAGGDGVGECVLATDHGGTVPNTVVPVATTSSGGDNVPLVGITDVLPASPTHFTLECNESSGDISYTGGTVTAVAIAPD